MDIKISLTITVPDGADVTFDTDAPETPVAESTPDKPKRTRKKKVVADEPKPTIEEQKAVVEEATVDLETPNPEAEAIPVEITLDDLDGDPADTDMPVDLSAEEICNEFSAGEMKEAEFRTLVLKTDFSDVPYEVLKSACMKLGTEKLQKVLGKIAQLKFKSLQQVPTEKYTAILRAAFI